MSSKRAVRRKQCGDKTAYQTRQQAAGVAHFLSESQRESVQAYKCPHCHHWHVGHWSPRR